MMADGAQVDDVQVVEDLMENADAAVALMRSLSNQTRLMILCRLVGGELTVGALADEIGLSQPITSQSLSRLRAEGYVASDRQGRSVTYRIADDRVRAVITALHDAFCPATA